MNTFKNRQMIWAAFPAVRSIFSVARCQIPRLGKNRKVKSLTTGFKQLATEKDAASIRAAMPTFIVGAENHDHGETNHQWPRSSVLIDSTT